MNVTLARGVYNVPLHRQALLFPDADRAAFPRAEAFTGDTGHICLPLWHAMSGQQVAQVDAWLKKCATLSP